MLDSGGLTALLGRSQHARAWFRWLVRRSATTGHTRPDKHPRLFQEELQDAKKHLLATPKLTQLYTRIDGVSIWRILLSETEHHVCVCYVVDEEADEMRILTVRGARHRRSPKF